tara:strand:+ start:17116 stop:17355 length:240 start_codon:yes stop_codon:yes gene_type:complete
MRKKIEEIIEQSFDIVRIGNKVYYTSKSKSDEKFKRRLEELLTLYGVVKSFYCYDKTVANAEEDYDFKKCNKQCEKCKK